MRALTWAGAALFAASLSYFAYFYLVRLGQPGDVPDAGTLRAVGVNVLLFTVFALHHSLLARSGAKAWVSRHINPAMERSTYVWIASLLFLAVCLGWQMIPGTAWQTTGAARPLCYGIQIAGLALTLRSASRIDIWDLAGVRPARSPDSAPSASSAASAPSAASALEISGPYRWVRHPIYLGWVLLVFGTPTMTMGRLLFAGISTLYLVVAIPLEERSLRQEFGPAYGRYQQQVRWRLVPGVW